MHASMASSIEFLGKSAMGFDFTSQLFTWLVLPPTLPLPQPPLSLTNTGLSAAGFPWFLPAAPALLVESNLSLSWVVVRSRAFFVQSTAVTIESA
jgi:hypothetical protein